MGVNEGGRHGHSNELKEEKGVGLRKEGNWAKSWGELVRWIWGDSNLTGRLGGAGWGGDKKGRGEYGAVQMVWELGKRTSVGGGAIWVLSLCGGRGDANGKGNPRNGASQTSKKGDRAKLTKKRLSEVHGGGGAKGGERPRNGINCSDKKCPRRSGRKKDHA